MIPLGGFLAVTPPGNRVPLFLITPVTLSYNEGPKNFITAPQTPPFSLVADILGSFSAAISASAGAFSVRADLIRTGVYGTILIDSMLFEFNTASIYLEPCPPDFPYIDDVSVPIFFNNELSHPTNFTADTSIAVLITQE